MNVQSKKYATQAPAWTSIDCLLLPGNYNLLPVLTNNFLMNQLLLEKRRCWGKKWIERRHSKKDAVGKGLAFFSGINMMYSRMCSNRCKGNQMHTTNMTTHVPIYKVRACVHDSDHMISACRTSSLPLYIIIVFGTLTQKKHIHNYTDTQVIPITHRVNAKLRLLICHQAYCPGWSNRILRCVCFFLCFFYVFLQGILPPKKENWSDLYCIWTETFFGTI